MGYRTQAEWDAARKVVKAEAAEVIKANAAKAKEAKDKALGRNSEKATKAFEKALEAKLAKRASRVKPTAEVPAPVIQ